MTGFGVGDARLPAGRLVAEIRSTNQRFLDVRARLPREAADLSLFAEQIVRERLRRGRVELVVHVEGAMLSARALDKDRARAAFKAFAELRDELAPGAEVPLSLLASVPDLFAPADTAELARVRAGVKKAVENALAAMDAMCRTEGAALAADLTQRAQNLEALFTELATAVTGSREAARARARERVDKLLAAVATVNPDGTARVDVARIEAEIVVLAERADVAEELTRLASHLDQVRKLIAAGGAEPVGRQLDFLLQEMLREANTLGAKAQDAGLGQRVVAVKVELERLREQVQNVE